MIPAVVGTMCGHRCGQEVFHRVSDDRRSGQGAIGRNPQVRNNEYRTGEIDGLAGIQRLYAHRDGERTRRDERSFTVRCQTEFDTNDGESIENKGPQSEW